MKQDRLLALRQRLKRGSFEFGALLEGVSTLDDAARERADADQDDREPDTGLDDAMPPVARSAVREESEAVLLASIDVVEEVISDSLPAAELGEQPLLPLLEEETPIAASPASHDPRAERLRVALNALGCRLLQECGSLRSALADRDVEESGFHLAHVNQVLELLHDIDPDGQMARQLRTAAAPPVGRAWPAASWTAVEFAASPFSALLPQEADDCFVRDLLYASWGVRFEAAGGNRPAAPRNGSAAIPVGAAAGGA